ncbi:MAG: toll/interleukin-1 receptor domain-containing protein, partial [Gammaproteobacteria bacterium]|nr:toll/interleukin-1 receptor domain-containing protein [Gammaproteobacteria bacterium]
MTAKTVFLSYRRDAIGKPFARLIEQFLTGRGYDVFLDVDAMAPGIWAEQLQREVPARAHFLLLLTPGALARCANPDDWVRREYELAVRHGRNIVPIQEEGFDVAHERTDCPEAMAGVFNLQFAAISTAHFAHDMDELVQRYIPGHKAPGDALGNDERVAGVSRHKASGDAPGNDERVAGVERPRREPPG